MVENFEDLKWLDNYTNCFVLDSNDIDVFYEPNEFYQNLIVKFYKIKF